MIKNLFKRAALASMLVSLLGASGIAKASFEQASKAFDKSDYSTALQLVQQCADQGGCQYLLAQMARLGFGMEVDHRTAAMAFEKSASLGHSDSYYLAGFYHFEGKAIPQDYSKAIAWFEKGVNAKDASSAFILGSMAENGLGMPTDYAKAVKYYEIAAEGSNHEAFFRIAELHRVGGPNLEKSFEAAILYHCIAARRGNKNAIGVLAKLYPNDDPILVITDTLPMYTTINADRKLVKTLKRGDRVNPIAVNQGSPYVYVFESESYQFGFIESFGAEKISLMKKK